MQKMSKISNVGVVVTTICFIITGCTKTDNNTETETLPGSQPAAGFSIYVLSDDGASFIGSQATYIDSNFYFRNGSDSGVTMSYKWDFGDGSSSTEKNPVHKYAKRGTYQVLLTVNKDNKVLDTVQKLLRVVLGEQYVVFPNGLNLDPISIVELSSGDFTLLAASDNFAVYHLYTLDSLFKVKSKIDLLSARLSSLVATNDGNYIGTGYNASDTGLTQIVKLSSDGKVIWAHKRTAGNYRFAGVSSDGGIVGVGDKMVETQTGFIQHTILTKTDANGNFQWDKYLSKENVNNTKNAVFETDGIVVAGTSPGACEACDSVIIVKLDFSGQVIWRNAVYGGFNPRGPRVWISKLANGTYAVTNDNSNGIFIFSPAGGFVDRKSVAHGVYAVTSSDDGNMLALQVEGGLDHKIAVTKIRMDGSLEWTANPNHYLKYPDGKISCCSTSGPVSITSLRNGGTVILGTRLNIATDAPTNHLVALLLPLDDFGKPF